MRSMRDPAPSRLAYRMHRLMLTPTFRVFLKFGLPVLAVVTLVVFWASDDQRVEDAQDRLAEIKRDIEQRPEFLVRMMAVENGSPEVDKEIRTLLPIDFPISSFDLELDDIQATVESLDAVAAASVHIRSGGVLSVEVTERIPVVVWRSDDGLLLLDQEGHRVSEIAARTERPDLPLIVGVGADAAVGEALGLYAMANPIEERLRGFVRVGERRWDLVFDRQQRVMLPATHPETALAKVIALDTSQDLLARDIAAIDFRTRTDLCFV
ncbi:MAG: cell division protein FtsQ/DivIB [Boseongicola sp.]|nr:cell division protein FtsQ/DivIB [Boseongicola sp.]